MWTLQHRPQTWLRLSKLEPLAILDELDGPRLFTLQSDNGLECLAYQCGEDAFVQRFLIIPTDARIVRDIQNGQLSLRDALLNQALLCAVDRLANGSITVPVAVDVTELPDSALPEEGVTLHERPAFLRVRMVGKNLHRHHVPASVVQRAVEGATNAAKVLIGHVLDVRKEQGRPAEWFRKTYDLPAVDFAFRSFEITFGLPETPSQQDALVDASKVVEEASQLLRQGLEWAKDSSAPTKLPTTSWPTIIDALSYLTPPRRGTVEQVEVGGVLSGSLSRAVILSRDVSERVSTAKRELTLSNPTELSFDGYVRAMDKDAQSFWLRDGQSVNIIEVAFTPDQYEQVMVALDTDVWVTVLVHRPPGSRSGHLRAIAVKGQRPALGSVTGLPSPDQAE